MWDTFSAVVSDAVASIGEPAAKFLQDGGSITIAAIFLTFIIAALSRVIYDWVVTKLTVWLKKEHRLAFLSIAICLSAIALVARCPITMAAILLATVLKIAGPRPLRIAFSARRTLVVVMLVLLVTGASEYRVVSARNSTE